MVNKHALDTAQLKARKKTRGYQPGQPRFHCDQDDCPASFARLEHLKRHKMSHDKSISFVCEYCQRSFARKDIKTRHIRRQHEKEDVSDELEDTVKTTTEKKSKPEQVPPPPTAQQLPPPPAPPTKRAFNYSSPDFSDNTGSPEAILGNSSQLVSQMQNEDFMNWLFAQSPGVTDITPLSAGDYSNVNIFQDVDMIADPIPEYLFPDGNQQHTHTISTQAGAAAAALTPMQSNAGGGTTCGGPATAPGAQTGAGAAKSPDSTGSLPPLEEEPCNQQTCDNLRQSLGLQNTELVSRYINPGFVTYAVNLYWSLHIRWPILHRPSFAINQCPPYLLVSMITISMYLTRKEDAIELAVALHEELRYRVYTLPEFKTSSAIWVFQTLLLAEIFEKMCSSEEQHDLATRFHDVLIASMRKGGGNKMDTDSWHAIPPADTDPEWQRFIDHESRKRVAFFAFVVDAQHTALFNNPPSMFISDLRFRLPCDEALWEAPDASHWRKIKDSYPPPPHFTTTIGSFLRLDNNNPAQPQLSPWSMMVILHGLISVGWNMRLRESMSPDQFNSDNNNTEDNSAQWVRTISESYNGWLRHYRLTYIVNGKLPFNHPYLLGILTTYEFAHVILNTDIDDPQIFVNQLSQFKLLGHLPRVSSNLQLAEVIDKWATSSQGSQAMCHALDLIDMFLLGENQYDVTKETAFHRTWCLYVAAVIVWVYHYFSTTLRPDFAYAHYNHQPADQQGSSYTAVRHYLGRVRALVSRPRPSHEEIARQPSYTILMSRQNIDNCEANILLNHVYDLLKPCRWGVMQARLDIIKNLLNK